MTVSLLALWTCQYWAIQNILLIKLNCMSLGFSRQPATRRLPWLWMTLLHWDPRVQVLHWHENDRVHCYHNEFSDLTHLCMAVPLSKGKNSGRLAVSLYEKKGHPNYPNLRWLNLYGSVRGGSLERTRKFMPGVEVVSEQCCLRLWDWV